jgi:hypothetical protein
MCRIGTPGISDGLDKLDNIAAADFCDRPLAPFRD